MAPAPPATAPTNPARSPRSLPTLTAAEIKAGWAARADARSPRSPADVARSPRPATIARQRVRLTTSDGRAAAAATAAAAALGQPRLDGGAAAEGARRASPRAASSRRRHQHEPSAERVGSTHSRSAEASRQPPRLRDSRRPPSRKSTTCSAPRRSSSPTTSTVPSGMRSPRELEAYALPGAHADGARPGGLPPLLHQQDATGRACEARIKEGAPPATLLDVLAAAPDAASLGRAYRAIRSTSSRRA